MYQGGFGLLFYSFLISIPLETSPANESKGKRGLMQANPQQPWQLFSVLTNVFSGFRRDIVQWKAMFTGVPLQSKRCCQPGTGYSAHPEAGIRR